MKTKEITPLIHIEYDDKWEKYDEGIVFSIIRNIESDFAYCLGRTSKKMCILRHIESGPKCTGQDIHIIYLSSKGNYWCQWIYQFAHEYCHHLIDGTMSGEIKGLLWFEETICELSSLFHLNNFWHKCLITPSLYYYAPAVQDYHNDLVRQNPQLVELFRRESLFQWGDLLKEPAYHRDIYNAMAVSILPIVLKTPQLWKMILHFGDMRSWNSPDELFDHLLYTATDDYRRALLDLKELFLP